MTASVTIGRALRYAKGCARSLLHHASRHDPTLLTEPMATGAKPETVQIPTAGARYGRFS
ncbi:hypothetical protein [Jiella pelagia]|uniref:Uncharacterized protein n=1 Tax=Jiella pelagia TaxID=2986949 RepID=A0ABY7C6B3_9HYPH|nr:hypothetical protein [Jiella pelagia]WAP69380.1 hypothetical protein OH818_03595 [Jiella pelagia]